jgi:hypothetical protein
MRVDEQTGKEGGKSRVTDYLKNEVAERMFERFEVGPESFNKVSLSSKSRLVILISRFVLLNRK